MQRDLRFRAVTDGEIRRRLHWGSFFNDLEGFEEVKVTDVSIFRPYFKHTKLFTEAGEERASVVICTGKIKHVRSSFLHEFEYLKSLVEPDRVKDIKMSLSSLELYHLIYKQGHAYPSSVYASDDEYFADLAVAFREEAKILYNAGLRNLQIDDPSLTCTFYHPPFFDNQISILTYSRFL
jgi:methionine synthase II (cobalamin-independent)